MNTKNLLVSFVAIAMILSLTAVVSAEDITTDTYVEIDGISPGNHDVSVVAGDTVTVKVYFEADHSDTDVTVEAEIEGDKVDTEAKTDVFDVIAGQAYKKTLSIKVPYELKDEKSDELTLTITIDGKDYKTELDKITLTVQRPSYNVDFKSINVPGTIKAGETIPVDIVVKNIGYNDLDDLYVVAKIPALGIQETAYFGDLVYSDSADEYEDDDDATDTVSGRIYVEIPYEVASGIYTLEVEASSDDLTLNEVKQIAIKNEFSQTIIQTDKGLLIVNPTDELKIYRVVFPTNEEFVSVQAGSSVEVEVTADSEVYTVSVLTMNGEPVDSFTFSKAVADESQTTDAIVILTVILAIIFLVLLVVLVVLIRKKPEKSEDFGESYY